MNAANARHCRLLTRRTIYPAGQPADGCTSHRRAYLQHIDPAGPAAPGNVQPGVPERSRNNARWL